jgi:hypothetical protein
MEILPGDFSFLQKRFYRDSLMFDYELFSQNNLWDKLYVGDYSLINSFFKDKMYIFHTEESFKNNLFFLSYIHKYGWEKFVTKLNSKTTLPETSSDKDLKTPLPTK